MVLSMTVPLFLHHANISPISYDATFYARVVDISDLIVNMPHKHVGNNMGRETIDNLVEQVRSVWKRVGSIPACSIMSSVP